MRGAGREGRVRGGRRALAAAAVLILAATLAVFRPVTGFDFVNYDDDRTVTANPPVLSGLNTRSLQWAFTTIQTGNWHPLTWISHLAAVEIFGLDARGHHGVNLFLHAANALLLLAALGAATGSVWRSAAVAALFAVHPLHVESVAWVSERKDVLSALFWLLGIVAYVHYARRPSRARFLLVGTLLVLGLATKAMVVSLPLVLLLLDWWPLGRFRSGRADGVAVPVARGRLAALVVEKIPLFLIAGVFAAAAFAAQRGVPLLVPLEAHPFPARLANALFAYLWYLGKAVWPASLAVFYPFPPGGPPLWKPALALLLLVAISVFALRGRRARPAVAVGWLWYLGTLAPVIGLVQAGDQAMADRYTYLPLIGVFAAVAWGAGDVLSRRGVPSAATGIVVVALTAALAVTAAFQVRHWKSSRTLFERAARVTAANPVAYNNLALALMAEGRPAEAVELYRRALQIRPEAVIYANLGLALSRLGRHQEAVDAYRTALALDPSLEEVRPWLEDAVRRR